MGVVQPHVPQITVSSLSDSTELLFSPAVAVSKCSLSLSPSLLEPGSPRQGRGLRQLQMTKPYLAFGMLPPHGKAHRMSPSAIRPRIPQPGDISQHLAAQVIFDLHVRERGIDLEYLTVGQLANAAGVVKVVFCEQPGTCVRTDAEEGLESRLIKTQRVNQIIWILGARSMLGGTGVFMGFRDCHLIN